MAAESLDKATLCLGSDITWLVLGLLSGRKNRGFGTARLCSTMGRRVNALKGS